MCYAWLAAARRPPAAGRRPPALGRAAAPFATVSGRKMPTAAVDAVRPARRYCSMNRNDCVNVVDSGRAS